MKKRLHCSSFHSVKGGVGKSTLSVLTAVALAEAHPEARVYLVDMDLTGTSLADVLPLEAPHWDGVGPKDPIALLAPPSGFLAASETSPRIESRGEAERGEPEAIGVPFLNDFLLFKTPSWDEESDVPIDAIAWKLAQGPENLRVLPSSALPRDLEQALPVIYDEEHAAFLEGRLEYLLAAMLQAHDEAFVVFDTPPTIPGLSNSVLSLAFRLCAEPKKSLSEDGFMPARLEDAGVDFHAFIVATPDYQDVRAARRWLDRVRDEENDVVQFVVNRASGEPQQRQDELDKALRLPSASGSARGPADPEALDSLGALVANPVWVEESVELRSLFRREDPLPALGKLLRDLGLEQETA